MRSSQPFILNLVNLYCFRANKHLKTITNSLQTKGNKKVSF